MQIDHPTRTQLSASHVTVDRRLNPRGGSAATSFEDAPTFLYTCSINPSIHPSIRPPIHPSTYPFINLSIHLFIFASVLLIRKFTPSATHRYFFLSSIISSSISFNFQAHVLCLRFFVSRQISLGRLVRLRRIFFQGQSIIH